MKTFMDEEFLLDTPAASHLYHDYAEHMPILDFHCHLSPKEIYDDIHFADISEVWLGADHYKWRLMRSAGIEEKYITGDASGKEKFIAYARALELSIGSPLYHWSHLELKRYFGFDGYLNAANAEEVYAMCNEKLQDMSARQLIAASHVEALCTTDDPIDSLEYHRLLKEEGFAVKVVPAWRPDRILAMEKPDYPSYMHTLEQVSGVTIDTFAALRKAIEIRMDFFAEHGCVLSDHGMDAIPYCEASEEQLDSLLKRRMSGECLRMEEMEQYRTAVLIFLAEAYARRGWTMQIHYGVIRNLNSRIFKALGADAGIDAITTETSMVKLGSLLDAMNERGLPKTVLYPLNPNEFPAAATVMGCFQDSTAVGRIQLGAAWWFNDHKSGMTKQLTTLAELGVLGSFIGMLTDSRSFLSYTRHEYFRRILCNLIGAWVENGEYPCDEEALKTIVEGIAYRNAKAYLGI